MRTLGSIVRKHRKIKRMTLEELAAAVPGYDAANLSRFERGAQGIALDKLRPLAKALGISVATIYSESDLDVNSDVDASTLIDPVSYASKVNSVDNGIYIHIKYVPCLHIVKGETFMDFIGNQTAVDIRFDEDVLAKAGAQPDKVFAFKVQDNNMDPVIPAGAQVTIDTTSTVIVNGKLYAINHNGMARIVKLYKQPGGGLRLFHYNSEEYAQETYPADVAEADIAIIGAIIFYTVTTL